ncbi:hypothetical protein ACO03V_04910 [Microbacterium sp. HMH0099]|uniref:hypothetical protein n=1 Tax=Microbacterium sp. HMH0099 TaxID=3414026 RepID=UPI003BF6A7E6
MTDRKWLAVVFVTVSFIVTLSGCNGRTNVNDELTVSDAKASTQAVEREIVERLPGEYVGTIEQLAAGSFLSCVDGSYLWSGFIRAQITGDPDAAALLDPVMAEFENRRGFEAQYRDSLGDRVLDISNEEGALWIVSYERRRRELSVDSASACFHLPDEIWPGDSY